MFCHGYYTCINTGTILYKLHFILEFHFFQMWMFSLEIRTCYGYRLCSLRAANATGKTFSSHQCEYFLYACYTRILCLFDIPYASESDRLHALVMPRTGIIYRIGIIDFLACKWLVRCFMQSCTVILFIVASIFLYFSIRKQRITNGVDPMKQFNVIKPKNWIILDLSRFVKREQKWCETKDSYTNCGCEDVYIYLFFLSQK